MQQNETTYTAALNGALAVAGPADDHWNERFISALHNRGLMLAGGSVSYYKATLYPKGGPLNAPRPYGGEELWCHKTVVVWAPIPRP